MKVDFPVLNKIVETVMNLNVEEGRRFNLKEVD